MAKNSTIFIFIILMFSCSSTGVDPESSFDPNRYNQFIPLKIGNYWIYSSFRFDENEEIIEGSQSIDSIVVSQKLEFVGKDAFLLQVYSNNTLTDTIYYSYFNDIYFQYVFDDYLPVNDIEDQWIKIIDANESDWLELNSDNNLENIIYENSNYEALTDLNMFIDYEGFERIELIDTSFNVFTFDEYFDSQAFITNAYQLNGGNIDLTIYRTQSIKRHFRDSLGLVATVQYNRKKRVLHKLGEEIIREENEFLPGKTSILIRSKTN